MANLPTWSLDATQLHKSEGLIGRYGVCPLRWREQEEEMIGKPIALIQVPNQRVFGPKAAARYLDVHPQTLKKMTDETKIKAKWMRNRKIYTLDELDRYIESLEPYNGHQVERRESPNGSK